MKKHGFSCFPACFVNSGKCSEHVPERGAEPLAPEELRRDGARRNAVKMRCCLKDRGKDVLRHSCRSGCIRLLWTFCVSVMWTPKFINTGNE